MCIRDRVMVEGMLEELQALGFRLEPFGKQNMLLTGVPPEAEGNEILIFNGLLEQLRANTDRLKTGVGDHLARALAKRASVKRGQSLDKAQLEALVTGLFSSPMPSVTPDGRPTFFIFEASVMEGYFP